MFKAILALALMSTADSASDQLHDFTRQFVSSNRETALVCVGTIEDLGVVQKIFLVAIPQAVRFRIDRHLRGPWTQKHAEVEYVNVSGQPLPPPFALGARLIVFAEVVENPSSPPRALGAVIRKAKVPPRYAVFPATDANIQLVVRTLAEPVKKDGKKHQPGTPLHTH